MQERIEIEKGLYLRKRPESGVWYAFKRYRGKQIRWSTGTKDAKEAAAKARKPRLFLQAPYTAVNRNYYEQALATAKKNASAKGLDFDLTPYWLDKIIRQQGDRCAVTHLPFKYLKGIGSGRQPFYPSVDRIDSSVGYFQDNCRLVCMAANYAMHTWGEWVLDELTQARFFTHPLPRTARHGD